jgi:hypothetical protein
MASKTNGVFFFDRYMCFFNSAEQAYLEQSEPVSTLKNLSCRTYSIQKPTQYSQGNNGLHAPAPNRNDFLSRDTCVSSIQLNRTIWKKQRLSPS